MRDAEFLFGVEQESRSTLGEVLSLAYVYRFRIIVAAVIIAQGLKTLVCAKLSILIGGIQ